MVASWFLAVSAGSAEGRPGTIQIDGVLPLGPGSGGEVVEAVAELTRFRSELADAAAHAAAAADSRAREARPCPFGGTGVDLNFVVGVRQW